MFKIFCSEMKFKLCLQRGGLLPGISFHRGSPVNAGRTVFISYSHIWFTKLFQRRMELCGLVSGLFPKKLIPLKLQLWALWLCIFNFQQIFSTTFVININTSFISDAGRGKFRGVSQNNAGLQDEGDVQAEHGGARRVAAVQPCDHLMPLVCRTVHVPAGHSHTGTHSGLVRPLSGGWAVDTGSLQSYWSI